MRGPLLQHLFVVQGDIALAVKLIDAQFPPYEQVIPKDLIEPTGGDQAVLRAASPLHEQARERAPPPCPRRG